jgi:hypothetical protein
VQRHACAVLFQVTEIDIPGARHSRSGPAILAEAGGTAWCHIAPVNRAGPDQARARRAPRPGRGWACTGL